MFEDNTQSQQSGGQQPEQGVPQPTVMPPAGQPAQEPTDMFAGVDRSTPTEPTQEATQPQGSGAGYTFEEEGETKPWYMQKKFIVLLLGAVLLLIIIIFGVQFALRFFSPASVPEPGAVPTSTGSEIPEAATPTSPVQEIPQEVPAQAEEGTAPVPETQAESAAAPQAGGPDTDSDGLTDSEEQALGTNSTLADTDGDELSDREEFRVFGTDPLTPDTDGDTYLDGAEVKNGYDPKGQGKLFTVPLTE